MNYENYVAYGSALNLNIYEQDNVSLFVAECISPSNQIENLLIHQYQLRLPNNSTLTEYLVVGRINDLKLSDYKFASQLNQYIIALTKKRPEERFVMFKNFVESSKVIKNKEISFTQEGYDLMLGKGIDLGRIERTISVDYRVIENDIKIPKNASYRINDTGDNILYPENPFQPIQNYIKEGYLLNPVEYGFLLEPSKNAFKRQYFYNNRYLFAHLLQLSKRYYSQKIVQNDLLSATYDKYIDLLEKERQLNNMSSKNDSEIDLKSIFGKRLLILEALRSTTNDLVLLLIQSQFHKNYEPKVTRRGT